MATLGEIDRLREIADLVERWNAVGEAQARTALVASELAGLRKEIVRTMKVEGRTLQAIADVLGISKARVAQIASQVGL